MTENYIYMKSVYIEMVVGQEGKRTTSELLKLIIKSVSEGEKSILEIAKDVESNWETVKNYLETLKEARLVEEQDYGNKRIFVIIDRKQNKTYFGLPLDEQKEKLIKNLFFLINEKWQQIKGKQITQLQAQKILYDLNTKLNLEIPMGKYIYGEIAILPCTTQEFYPEIKIGQDIIDELNLCVEATAKDNFAYETKDKHYKKICDLTYTTKENTFKILYSQSFNKQSIKQINENVSKILLKEWVYISDPESKTILEEYSTLLFDISSQYTEPLFEQNKRNFIILFENIWKLIAMFIFKNDLKKNYSENVLDICFSYDIEIQKRDILQIAKELQNQVIEEEPNDETYLELKKIKNLSNEPKKDFSKMNRKNLFNEVDL